MDRISYTDYGEERSLINDRFDFGRLHNWKSFVRFRVEAHHSARPSRAAGLEERILAGWWLGAVLDQRGEVIREHECVLVVWVPLNRQRMTEWFFGK